MNYFGTNRKVKVDSCDWVGPKIRLTGSKLEAERTEYLNEIVTHINRFKLGDVGSMEPVPDGLKAKFKVTDMLNCELNTRVVRITGKRGELEAYFGRLNEEGYDE